MWKKTDSRFKKMVRVTAEDSTYLKEMKIEKRYTSAGKLEAIIEFYKKYGKTINKP